MNDSEENYEELSSDSGPLHNMRNASKGNENQMERVAQGAQPADDWIRIEVEPPKIALDLEEFSANLTSMGQEREQLLQTPTVLST